MGIGLPDKAVAGSCVRVCSALTALELALLAKRITVNLAPADLPKEPQTLIRAAEWASPIPISDFVNF